MPVKICILHWYLHVLCTLCVSALSSCANEHDHNHKLKCSVPTYYLWAREISPHRKHFISTNGVKTLFNYQIVMHTWEQINYDFKVTMVTIPVQLKKIDSWIIMNICILILLLYKLNSYIIIHTFLNFRYMVAEFLLKCESSMDNCFTMTNGSSVVC